MQDKEATMVAITEAEMTTPPRRCGDRPSSSSAPAAPPDRGDYLYSIEVFDVQVKPHTLRRLSIALREIGPESRLVPCVGRLHRMKQNSVHRGISQLLQRREKPPYELDLSIRPSYGHNETTLKKVVIHCVTKKWSQFGLEQGGKRKHGKAPESKWCNCDGLNEYSRTSDCLSLGQPMPHEGDLLKSMCDQVDVIVDGSSLRQRKQGDRSNPDNVALLLEDLLEVLTRDMMIKEINFTMFALETEDAVSIIFYLGKLFSDPRGEKYCSSSREMIQVSKKRKRKNKVVRSGKEKETVVRSGKEKEGDMLLDAGEEAPPPHALPPKKFCPNRRLIKIQDVIKTLVLGKRSRFDAKEWICKRCSWTNKPQKHLIAYLPPFHCENCNLSFLSMDDYEFSFSMADVTVNGFPPIGNIKDQGNTDLCTLYATAQSLEITERMSRILAGQEPEGIFKEGPVLDITDLLKKTEDMMKDCKVNQWKGDPKFNYKSLRVSFEVAERKGVKQLTNDAYGLTEIKPRIIKASGKQFLDSDFSKIAQRLADGIPQVVYFPVGKKFADLKHGQIYKPPKIPACDNHNKKIIYHAVVLIGAGKRRKTYFYHFVNSHNVRFCLRVSGNKVDRRKLTWIGGFHNGKAKQIPGGIGMVRASDIIYKSLEFRRYPNAGLPGRPWVSLGYCLSP